VPPGTNESFVTACSLRANGNYRNCEIISSTDFNMWLFLCSSSYYICYIHNGVMKFL
jgi:hypothetical protein